MSLVISSIGLDLPVESWFELFGQTQHLPILVGILVTLNIIQFVNICYINHRERRTIIQHRRDGAAIHRSNTTALLAHLKETHLEEIDHLKVQHRLHIKAVVDSQRTAIAALTQCIQHNAFVPPQTHNLATQFTSNAVAHLCTKFESFPHRDVVTGPYSNTLHPRQPQRAWIARGSGQKLHNQENCPGLAASTSTTSLSDTCDYCNKRTRDYNNECPPPERFFTVEEF